MSCWNVIERMRAFYTCGLYFSPFKKIDFVSWRLATLGKWQAQTEWNRLNKHD